MVNEYKYDEIDLGLNAVDEEELVSIKSTNDEVSKKIDTTNVEVKHVLEKMDVFLEKQNDVLRELLSTKQLYEDKSSSIDISKEVVEDKLLKVERMIMPLLYNLMKNDDKDYIYWPNREVIIKKQIDEILLLTGGDRDNG
jgi:septal ring factor EnvC (AmiA/AmiB activator)